MLSSSLMRGCRSQASHAEVAKTEGNIGGVRIEPREEPGTGAAAGRSDTGL